MLIGYARVSKTDGSQSLDLQRDALRAGTATPSAYRHRASRRLYPPSRKQPVPALPPPTVAFA